MVHMAQIAEYLILNTILSDNAPFSKGTKISAILLAISAFLVFVASLFLVYAAYLWLSTNYQPDEAAAITGVLVLGVAILFMLTAVAVWQYKRARMKRFQQDLTGMLQQALGFVEEELSAPVQHNPKTATALASLAGFAVGEKLF